MLLETKETGNWQLISYHHCIDIFGIHHELPDINHYLRLQSRK